MDRQEVFGLHQRQDGFQFLLTGVARNVHVGQSAVDHIGALSEQLVDHGIHRLFVAGDGGGGDEDLVTAANFHLPVARKSHAVQGAHRLALAAGGDDGHFVAGIFVDLLEIHIGVGGQGEIAQLGAHLEDVLHAAARNGHLAAVLGGHVKDLLYPVDVGGEGGHDDAAVTALELPVERVAHLALAHGDARAFGVGGVHHQQQDALFAQLAQTGQVDHFAVDGGGVDLEVAGGDDHAQRGLDGKGAGVGDGVVHMEEFHLKTAGLDLVAVLFHGDLGFFQVLVLLQLELDQAGGKGGAVHRHVELPQDVGQGADVVLMGVGQKDAAKLVLVLLQIGDVGDDHVHAQQILVGEGHAGVDDDHVVVIFQNGHVLADLVETAQRDDLQLGARKGLGLLFGRFFAGLGLFAVGQQSARQVLDGLGGGLCGLLGHFHGLLGCLAGRSRLGGFGSGRLAAPAPGGGGFTGSFGCRLSGGRNAALAGLAGILFVFCHNGIKSPFFGGAAQSKKAPGENPLRRYALRDVRLLFIKIRPF